MSEKKSILVVGSNSHSLADTCVAWGDDFYIGDYDIVIFNPAELDPNRLQILKRDRPSYLENIKKHIVESQENRDLEVICILAPIRIASDLSDYSSAEDKLAWNNYSWSPIIPFLESVPEGKKIDFASSKISPNYLKLVNGWSLLWEKSINNTGFVDNKQLSNGQYLKTRITTKTLLENNVSRYIAFSCDWRLQQENESGYVFHTLKQSSEPIIFLPKVPDIKEGIELLLSELADACAETPPEWLKDINIANEGEIISEIASHSQEIETRKAQIMRLESEKANLGEYKKLLYESGKPLERIVEKAFAELGIIVTSPKVENIEDRQFIDKDANIPIEIRGKNAGLNEKDLNQLTSRFVDKPESIEYRTRGVFVLNHFRDIDPAKREQAFHPNIVAKASAWNVSLISTTTLFNLVKNKLERRQVPSLANTLFNSIGVFDFGESDLEQVPEVVEEAVA